MRILPPIVALLVAVVIVQLAGHSYFISGHDILANPFSSENDQDLFLKFGIILGALFVFCFYWFKFNEWAGEGMAPPGFRPRPVRHFTTSVRYFFWNNFYALMMTTIYLALVFFPEPIYRLIQSYLDAADTINTIRTNIFQNPETLGTSRQFAAPLIGQRDILAPYAVMLITVVWAGVHPFSQFEKRIRRHWQELADIPSQARQLVKAFENDDDSFAPAADVIEEVIKHLPNAILTKENFSDRGESLWFLYARFAYLNYLLEKYNRSSVFSRLAERYVNEFKNLEDRAANLHKMVVQRINTPQDILLATSKPSDLAEEMEQGTQRTPNGDGQTLKNTEIWLKENLVNAKKSQLDFFDQQEENLRAEIRSMTSDVIQFIICGVLAVGRSQPQRREMLEDFGYRQKNPPPIQLDPVTLTFVVSGVVLITLLCSMIYYLVVKFILTTGSDPINVGEIISKNYPKLNGKVPDTPAKALFWSAFAATMHLLAIMASYLTQSSAEKHRHYLRTRGLTQLPLFTQVAEALWAACVGLSVNIFLLAAVTAAQGNPEKLVTAWWWSFVPGVTALFTALYTQKGARSSRQLNWLLAGQGIITGGMAFLVYLVIRESYLEVTEQNISLAFGIYVLITTTFLGLALGKILQMWFTAFHFKGSSDRRKETRTRHWLKKITWHDQMGERTVRLVYLSHSTAQVRASLEIGSKGEIEIDKGKKRPAKVIECGDNDSSYKSCVMFLD
jgi:hypothetical protein